MKSFMPVEDEARRLIDVTLGRAHADLAVVNARMLNVYTGEILDGSQIAVSQKWIAYVGRNPEDTIGPQTEVIDAGGPRAFQVLVRGGDVVYKVTE